MSASRNTKGGKWGRLFMVVIFGCAMLVCIGLFFAQSRLVRVRHARSMAVEGMQSGSHGPSFREGQRQAAVAFRGARSQAQVDSQIQKRFKEAGWNDAIVVERRIRVTNNSFWQPVPAVEGGFDVERSLDRGARALARRIADDVSSRQSRGEVFRLIIVTAETGDENLAANRGLSRRVVQELGEMTRIWVTRDKTETLGARYWVRDRDHAVYGRVVEARSNHDKFRVSVLVDKEMVRIPAIPVLRDRRLELSFRTENTTSPLFAEEDALDGLRARIVSRIWRLGLARGYLDFNDHREFLGEMERRYSRDILVGMGRRSMQPTKTILNGEANEQDIVNYQTEVVWSGNARQLTRIADAVGDSIRTRNRAPFIRLGLSLGLCVLSLLTWLRVDWWLKGHYSLMSKLAFVILAALTVTAVWNYPIHG